MSRARRIAIWTLIVAVLAVLTWLRIRLIDGLHDQGWFVKYFELAGRVLAGAVPVERIGDVSPLYFWSVVGLRGAGLGVSELRDLQIAGLSIAALLCGMAAFRLGGWVAAVATAVLILGNRAALVVATDLEPEILIMLLNSAAILAVLTWESPRSRQPPQVAKIGSDVEGEDAEPPERAKPGTPSLVLPAAAGFLFGLSATARPVALGAIGLIGLWFLWQSRRAAVAFGIAALVPISVVLCVNYTLTGHMSVMQPGAVFYEANNPLATGCAGALPRIVLDLELASREPDFLHVAYRMIAARATGTPAGARTVNRYWSALAMNWIGSYPQRVLQLFGWKALLTVHNFDIYDLYTTRMKALELSRYPAIPFGAVFALAIVAFFVNGGRWAMLPLVLASLATLLALIVFNVSARQRNALLPPFAILAGTACAGVVRLARQKSDGALIAFGTAVVITPLLGIEGPPMKENDYNWRSAILSSKLRQDAFRLRREGKVREAFDAAAHATLLDPSRPALVSDEALRQHALRLVSTTEAPEYLFDIANALQRGGDWGASEVVLAKIEDYRPLRENLAVSSVAYYRARAALHLGATRGRVRELLDLAIREAPGDAHVLALRSILGDRSSPPLLNATSDPFSRDYALAVAYADAGQMGRADSLLGALERRFPEWKRPARLRHALRTAAARGGSSSGQAGR